jgi:DNA-binding response OmpR family regulator
VSTSRKRILIVEDDRFLRRACQARLEQEGYEILTAQDGEEGVKAARAANPDLVLLDLLMPRLNGLEVLRTLRNDEATRGMPVIILSNSSRQEDMDTIRSLGISGYFVKANLSLQDLSQLVGDLLRPAKVIGGGDATHPGH